MTQQRVLAAYDCQEIEFDYHDTNLLEMAVDPDARGMRWLGEIEVFPEGRNLGREVNA